MVCSKGVDLRGDRLKAVGHGVGHGIDHAIHELALAAPGSLLEAATHPLELSGRDPTNGQYAAAGDVNVDLHLAWGPVLLDVQREEDEQ